VLDRQLRFLLIQPLSAVMRPSAKYVLVTPTKDEEMTIGETLSSVVLQSVPPSEWIIVDDGSSDDTVELVAAMQVKYSWIKLIQLPPRIERCFGAVARATQLAVDHLSVVDYCFIGLLDSDVRLPPDYFKELMVRFNENPRLGLGGGRVLDPGEDINFVPDNLMDVPGAVQFFRRECFEALSAIYAIPEGGWDMLTCVESRLNGFETCLFPDLRVDHLKPRNIAHGGILRRRWQCGVRDYVLGYHPLFEVVKCLRRFRQSPFIFSGIAWWLGYISAALERRDRIVSGDLVEFLRREQTQRIKFSLCRCIRSHRRSLSYSSDAIL
jgi:poly-beta-1,6-N-acetyl-D-glucosamine synthase